MSLQGSIETFAVADVLRLLAATAKTGRLHVQGPARAGTVWVEASRIVAAESPATPYATGSADVVFQLLRFDRGSFRFEPDRHPTMPDVPVDIEFALGEAESMLHEWRELEHRIPSGEIWVQLRGRLASTSVTLSADEWATVAIISGGRTVNEIGEALRLGELQTAKAVARLLDLGLVEFGDRPAPVVEETRGPSAPVEPALPLVSVTAGSDLWSTPAVAPEQDESWLPPDLSVPAVPAAPAPAVAPVATTSPAAPPVPAPPAPAEAPALVPDAEAADAYSYPTGEDEGDAFTYPPAPPAPPVGGAADAGYPAVPPPLPPVYGGGDATAETAWSSAVSGAIAAAPGDGLFAPPPPPPPAPGGLATDLAAAAPVSDPADRLAPPPPPPPAPGAVTDDETEPEGTDTEAAGDADIERQLYNLSPRAREAVKQSSGLFDGRPRR